MTYDPTTEHSCRKCGAPAERDRLCAICYNLMEIAAAELERAAQFDQPHYRVRWHGGCYEIVERASQGVIMASASHVCIHQAAGLLNCGLALDAVVDLMRWPAPVERTP